MEKGYILYNCDWTEGQAPDGKIVAAIESARDKLYQKNFIGLYPNGFGFGNLSVRTEERQFIVTGTKTGGFTRLTPEHYTLVTGFSFEENRLSCSGPVQASSEALSHAALYLSDPAIKAVIHIHDEALWEKHYQKLPTTDPAAEPGTPAMAYAIQALYRSTPALRDTKVLVMGGHRPGLMSFGAGIDEACTVLLHLAERDKL